MACYGNRLVVADVIYKIILVVEVCILYATSHMSTIVTLSPFDYNNKFL